MPKKIQSQISPVRGVYCYSAAALVEVGAYSNHEIAASLTREPTQDPLDGEDQYYARSSYSSAYF